MVTDNGKGMSKEQVCKVIDPFFTTRTTRKVGMGIPLFKMEAEMTGGSFEIESDLNQGTKVTATFITTHLSKYRAFGFYFEYKGTKRYFGRNSSECT